jgi:lipid II:glycine glycyltransferase (peptidoglycan interpeptide bridge formation enzyme)
MTCVSLALTTIEFIVCFHCFSFVVVKERDEYGRQMDKLKNDLNTTKKESKKRKKLIETQQQILLNQRSTAHHTVESLVFGIISA